MKAAVKEAIKAFRETAKEVGHSWPKPRKGYTVRATAGETATANLENLNFKVPKSFRKRFRDCAYKADLKHNELLFAALGSDRSPRAIGMNSRAMTNPTTWPVVSPPPGRKARGLS